MRAKKSSTKPTVFKVGATYTELATGRSVTVVDHEVKRGGRTGRLVVETADGARDGRRWAVRAAALAELEAAARCPPLPNLEITSEPGAELIAPPSRGSQVGPAVRNADENGEGVSDDSWIWGGP